MGRKIVCVIPARLGSTRFPSKVLADLGGKPLMQWAYEGAIATDVFDEVALAVDSKELAEAAKAFGANVFLTSTACQNGTERLIELQQRGALSGSYWVNWQADEPFINQEVIDDLLQTCEDEGETIWTLKRQIDEEEAQSPHVVKVVTGSEGEALYFSRAPIPYRGPYFKHVGLYAYSEKALEKLAHLTPSLLEASEKLEQLRFLHHGLNIQVHETRQDILGVDTKEDLAKAESLCYTRSKT